MRNVTRVTKPRILVQKEEEWKRELLEELAKGINADKKRLKKLYKRYGHAKIRESLKRMYKFCCYCESRVEHVTVEHIEHRKPKAKDKFPECTFEWDNLHLSCPNCNGAKTDKWDEKNEILDAVIDNPISDFLSYRRCNRTYLDGRGKTTRDHAGLNREELLEAREILFNQVYDLIEIYNNDPDMPDAQIVPQKLEGLSKGQFGSFVKYLKENFLRDNND